jgi:hypothetical protein
MSQELMNLYDRLQELIQVLLYKGKHNKAVIDTYRHCALMVKDEARKNELTSKDRGVIQRANVNGTIIAVLESKQDWINRVPYCLPPKKSHAEVRLWVDSNGNCLFIGSDFSATEEHGAYPVTVYRLVRSSDFVPDVLSPLNPTT